MRVLLDTHTLLWAGLSPERLSRNARSLLASFSTQPLVSAASAWEIATKVRIGKLPGAAHFSAELGKRLELLGFVPLAISLEHARHAGSLPGAHRDPFDRMLAAQALTEDVPLVSRDHNLDVWGVRRIW